EVALIRALDASFELRLDPVTIAAIAHRAETGLVGAPVGIMDQMAASLADAREALFLDTRSRAYERLPLPRDTALVVIHSGVTHGQVPGESRAGRGGCGGGGRRLGVPALRDAPETAVCAAGLPPPLDRRARHVVTENDRVLRAREALRSADARAFGEL